MIETPMVLSEVVSKLDEIAPTRFAMSWDKVGLQVGDLGMEVTGITVSLDWADDVLFETVAGGANVIVCHHPLIWEPLKTVTSSTRSGRFVQSLIQKNVAFFAAHSNWDVAQGGVNDALADRLGLTNVRSFGSGAEVHEFKLVFFAPQNAVDNLITALSNLGAGEIGDYSRCAFSVPGTGTFRGSMTSNPTIGQPGQVESVEEVRVEMLVRDDILGQIPEVIKFHHPYEEPAYDMYRLATHTVHQLGRVGTLKTPMSPEEFRMHVDTSLRTKSYVWTGHKERIGTVAVIGGAADSEWHEAQKAGADAFVTGEVKQNVAVDAAEAGLTIVSAGHHATEQPGMKALAERLRNAMPDLSINLFEPNEGRVGRPLI